MRRAPASRGRGRASRRMRQAAAAATQKPSLVVRGRLLGGAPPGETMSATSALQLPERRPPRGERSCTGMGNHKRSRPESTAVSRLAAIDDQLLVELPAAKALTRQHARLHRESRQRMWSPAAAAGRSSIGLGTSNSALQNDSKPPYPCRQVALASIHYGCRQWLIAGSPRQLWFFIINEHQTKQAVSCEAVKALSVDCDIAAVGPAVAAAMVCRMGKYPIIKL